ncbi:hypothetical protein AKJ60_00300 [candidate division MSBL1 archaeon SCGC-AAA385M11]|nr:hypothetical protein AKJ60_00300 [candidate division MSBL1 archaeon SCGC-AAA385M11]
MSHQDRNQQVKFSYLQKFPNGRIMRTGLRLYQIKTEAFKDHFFWRLFEESTQPVWFHPQIQRDYFRQQLSEKKVTVKGKEYWKRVRRHNHWLDCAVGHLAMTHFQWSPPLQGLADSKRKEGRQTGRINSGTLVRPKTGTRPSWFNRR